jgi:hypothetical protein
MFRRIIKECLNELEDALLIHVHKQLMFVKRDSLGYYVSYEVSDEKTIQEFLSIGKKYMTEHGFENWSDIPYLTKNELRGKISNELGIEYFYDRYDIVVNKEYLPQKPLADVKKQLNDMAMEKISKSKQGVLKEWDYELVNECINLIVRC